MSTLLDTDVETMSDAGIFLPANAGDVWKIMNEGHDQTGNNLLVPAILAAIDSQAKDPKPTDMIIDNWATFNKQLVGYLEG